MLITLNNAARAKLSKKWNSRSLVDRCFIGGSGISNSPTGAAMTMTNASYSARGRRAVKFTPQAIEKIKEFVAQGVSRDEIANRLGVTVGSLQVTCSRLGISLRRSNGSRHRGSGSLGIAHVRQQNEVCSLAARAAPSAKFAITMRHRVPGAIL
jgi:hypothetical protein